ncbi:MAG: squalene/phytoene synthase family protein [bacterium]|nr:squalene/phytoene synthase family protein [bacterium]
MNTTVQMSVINPNEPLYQQALTEVHQIAHQHQENFARWLWIFSKEVRQDLMILYAFCRYADNLADANEPAEERLQHLENFEKNFARAAEKIPKPIFLIAVEELIQRRKLPKKEFHDLLYAFKLDQLRSQWESLDQLLEYSQYSANPVGRLVLGILAPQLLKSPYLEGSDDICTGLQLVNFWQDVVRDFQNHRIYLPQDYLHRYHVTNEQIQFRSVTDSFRQMMQALCNFTEQKFHAGRIAFRTVRGTVGFLIDWFATSGLQLLKEIKRKNYDTLTERPVLKTHHRIQSAFYSLLRI